ncbi:hypothetical protein GS907_24420 [Rhodococcus hoagii]|nr:hypothetical protein [Prescottella equi]
MNYPNQLPSALSAAVVHELLTTDTRTALTQFDSHRQHGSPPWQYLSPSQQLLHIALCGRQHLLHSPTPTLAEEPTVPQIQSPSQPREFSASHGRGRPVTDAEFDAAAVQAIAVTRPAPAPAVRTNVLRVVAGVVAAWCVFGYLLFEVVL